MKTLLCVLLTYLGLICNGEETSELPPQDTIHHLNLISPDVKTHEILNSQIKDPIDFIAVFELSSLNMAVELGETFKTVHGQSDCFARIRASEKTWAYGVKHFYSVVGAGDAEKRVLAKPNFCVNHTDTYLEQTKHVREPRLEQVFVCKNVKVLYLPYCVDGGWGEKGPCCRCEGAMKYYLNMARSDADFPLWFMFSDDDYFTRLYKLKGILDQVNPNKPYSITHQPGSIHAGNHDIQRINDYPLLFKDCECSVPCTNYASWLGYAIFSYGAMLVMEEEIRKNGLQQVCRLWSITHDVGLGLFAWEHSIPMIPICCGADRVHDGILESATYYHHVGKTKDSTGHPFSHNYLMHRIWEIGAKLRHETKPNATAYIEYEYNEGVKSYVPSIPSGGFQDSYFYRKVEFSRVVASQLREEQLMNYSNQLPIRVSTFGPGACDIEMQHHIKWRQQHQDKYPFGDVSEGYSKDQGHIYQAEAADTKIKNEVAMCMEYLEDLQNSPIHLNDIIMPSVEAVDRKRKRLLKQRQKRLQNTLYER